MLSAGCGDTAYHFAKGRLHARSFADGNQKLCVPPHK